MGVDAKWGCFPICPEMSRFVPVCPLLSRTKVCTGILRLRNPNLGPNSVKRILDARILDPNSWVEFLTLFFQQKRAPEKFTLEKFTSQYSPSKIQPRNRTKKFTLHLCRAVWLICCSGPQERQKRTNGDKTGHFGGIGGKLGNAPI